MVQCVILSRRSGRVMKKAKLLIVDGHNLLFQMFFGMPSRIINKVGK